MSGTTFRRTLASLLEIAAQHANISFGNREAKFAELLAAPFTGDTGTGGTIGFVPAPGAGSAAAGKFLKADGTFAVPTGVAPGGAAGGALAGTYPNPTLAHPITRLTGTVAAGSATAIVTVAGLLTTDTVLGVTQLAANANSLPLIGVSGLNGTQNPSSAGTMNALYSADPGASGTVIVAVLR